MAHVGISCPIDIDPASQTEAVLPAATFGTEMIEVSLDVLLHLFLEFGDDRVRQVEEIECVVPPPAIGPAHRVAIILPQSSSELLQPLVQVYGAISTEINPGGKQRH